MFRRFTALAASLLTAFAPIVAGGRTPEHRSVPEAGVQPVRLIVKLRPDSSSVRNFALSGSREPSVAKAILEERARALGARTGLDLRAGGAVSDLVQAMTVHGTSASSALTTVAADPDVEWVEVDGLMRIRRQPNDPLYLTGGSRGPASAQWALRAPSEQTPSAINAAGAWEVSTGRSEVVVAVLDTGAVLSHLDLQGQWVSGYDMVSDVEVANDGDSRDDDPSDPGDWVTSADASTATFSGCSVANSSWHGTQVAGIIAASTDNAIGIAGVGWGTRVMPVRVLGKCYGLTSDIAAAVRWAAGLSVAGVPASTRRADVINLSLGGGGSCSRTFQEAIDAATAAGVVVVAAAGNSAGQAVGSPANCRGVIAVAAVRHVGSKVGYSDLGPEIAVAAPGGNCVNTSSNDQCLYPLVTTTDSGSRGPAGSSSYSDAYNFSVGTSFSAPLVSGAVALIRAANPTVSPDGVRTLIQSTARPFPTSGGTQGTVACRSPDAREQLECYCTSQTCGAGLLDAGAALSAAAGASLTAVVDVTPAVPAAGQAVTLSAARSRVTSGRSIESYRWSLVDGGGIVDALDPSSTSSSSLVVVPNGAGRFTVRLEIADTSGQRATTTVQVDVHDVDPDTQQSTDGSSGGGALRIDWLLLVALAGAALRVRRGQRARR